MVQMQIFVNKVFSWLSSFAIFGISSFRQFANLKQFELNKKGFYKNIQVINSRDWMNECFKYFW